MTQRPRFKGCTSHTRVPGAEVALDRKQKEKKKRVELAGIFAFFFDWAFLPIFERFWQCDVGATRITSTVRDASRDEHCPSRLGPSLGGPCTPSVQALDPSRDAVLASYITKHRDELAPWFRLAGFSNLANHTPETGRETLPKPSPGEMAVIAALAF